MRTDCPHRLTFLLPPALVLLAPVGRLQPCLHGCVLHVSEHGLVQIDGPAREQVFAQAIRFLRVVAKGRPPLAFPGTLRSPCGRRDSWSIIVGADVAFSPTSIEPHMAEAADAAPTLAG